MDPGALGYIWPYYVQLSRQTPLSFREVAAWVELTGHDLNNFEVDLIFRLDYLNVKQSTEY